MRGKAKSIIIIIYANTIIFVQSSKCFYSFRTKTVYFDLSFSNVLIAIQMIKNIYKLRFDYNDSVKCL